MDDKNCEVINYITINSNKVIIGSCVNCGSAGGDNNGGGEGGNNGSDNNWDCNTPYYPNNPFDSIGALHNILLAEMIEYSNAGDAKATRVEVDVITRSVSESLHVLSRNNFKVVDTDRLLGMVVRVVDDINNNFLNFIKSSELSYEYQILISDLIKRIVELGNSGVEDNCTYKKIIIEYENNILSNFSLSNAEQVSLLCFFAILRYSFYFNLNTDFQKVSIKEFLIVIRIAVADAVAVLSTPVNGINDLETILINSTTASHAVASAYKNNNLLRKQKE
jgi:hypothetical protein